MDASAGLVPLTGAIAVILPLAARVATSPGPTVRLGRVALVAGCLLALVTAPAPLLHDTLIGQGTWLAEEVTHLAGNGGQPTGTHRHAHWMVEMGEQVAAATITYVPLLWVALQAARASIRLSRRAG